MEFYAKLMDVMSTEDHVVEDFLDETGFHRTTDLLTHFFKVAASGAPEVLVLEVEDGDLVRCGAVYVTKFEEDFTWGNEDDTLGPFRRAHKK